MEPARCAHRITYEFRVALAADDAVLTPSSAAGEGGIESQCPPLTSAGATAPPDSFLSWIQGIFQVTICCELLQAQLLGKLSCNLKRTLSIEGEGVKIVIPDTSAPFFKWKSTAYLGRELMFLQFGGGTVAIYNHLCPSASLLSTILEAPASTWYQLSAARASPGGGAASQVSPVDNHHFSELLAWKASLHVTSISSTLDTN